MDLQENNDPPGPSVEASLNDQHFLLNFIMITYLGPDVKSDNPRRSASQRLAEGLPPYTLNDLGPSFVSTSQLESLYYYVMRNARPSLFLKLNLLHMYLKGNLPLPSSGLPEDSRQFTSFFPLSLHKQTRNPASFEIVKGIVFIDDPVTSYMKQEDLERFRHLSGIDNLKIDIEESLRYQHGFQTCREEGKQNYMKISEEAMAGNVSNENGDSIAKFLRALKKSRRCDPLQTPVLPHVVPTCLHSQRLSEAMGSPRTCNLGGPSMMPLFSIPNIEDCNSMASIVLTGTARKGRAGPPIGLVDIGVSKVAYFFQVALPGVRRDYCQFSCEIECDGKVHVRGLTATGERTILKHSRVFQMKFQQLCPPGPFTLSFSLPGPVDPRLFSPNFRSDGILEAVVMKYIE